MAKALSFPFPAGILSCCTDLLGVAPATPPEGVATALRFDGGALSSDPSLFFCCCCRPLATGVFFAEALPTVEEVLVVIKSELG